MEFVQSILSFVDEKSQEIAEKNFSPENAPPAYYGLTNSGITYVLPALVYFLVTIGLRFSPDIARIDFAKADMGSPTNIFVSGAGSIVIALAAQAVNTGFVSFFGRSFLASTLFSLTRLGLPYAFDPFYLVLFLSTPSVTGAGNLTTKLKNFTFHLLATLLVWSRLLPVFLAVGLIYAVASIAMTKAAIDGYIAQGAESIGINAARLANYPFISIFASRFGDMFATAKRYSSSFRATVLGITGFTLYQQGAFTGMPSILSGYYGVEAPNETVTLADNIPATLEQGVESLKTSANAAVESLTPKTGDSPSAPPASGAAPSSGPTVEKPTADKVPAGTSTGTGAAEGSKKTDASVVDTSDVMSYTLSALVASLLAVLVL